MLVNLMPPLNVISLNYGYLMRLITIIHFKLMSFALIAATLLTAALLIKLGKLRIFFCSVAKVVPRTDLLFVS